ncbi:MAG: HD domain-containing protein [Sulfolobales archaeon]|nr:HD domain-containing protein [Sulfolobales archaeon]MDW8083381.1 HD domain-containing protein [Sulfolobales archaeon]
MVTVSPALVRKFIENSSLLKRIYEFLEADEEVQSLIDMSNIMAVGRLRYNDHGIIHSRIVSGASLEIFDLLLKTRLKPTTLEFGIAKNIEECMVVVLTAAYLHDIGNAIHRVNHEFLGSLLAKDIVDRMLSDVMPHVEGRRRKMIRQEILHAIYATETNTQALTVEAGVVKVADGTDMAEGRARIPYKLGKINMHSVSALSIKKVEILSGNGRPVSIEITMDNFAGLFQIEAVLKPKILSTGIADYFDITAKIGDREIKVYP